MTVTGGPWAPWPTSRTTFRTRLLGPVAWALPGGTGQVAEEAEVTGTTNRPSLNSLEPLATEVNSESFPPRFYAFARATLIGIVVKMLPLRKDQAFEM